MQQACYISHKKRKRIILGVIMLLLVGLVSWWCWWRFYWHEYPAAEVAIMERINPGPEWKRGELYVQDRRNFCIKNCMEVSMSFTADKPVFDRASFMSFLKRIHPALVIEDESQCQNSENGKIDINCSYGKGVDGVYYALYLFQSDTGMNKLNISLRDYKASTK